MNYQCPICGNTFTIIGKLDAVHCNGGPEPQRNSHEPTRVVPKTRGAFPEFSYPLTPAERHQAAALLRSGQSCVVGDYWLYADNGFIEADNAYGQPAIWSKESAADDALRWVDDQYAHDEAERAAFEDDNGGPYIDYAAIAENTGLQR